MARNHTGHKRKMPPQLTPFRRVIYRQIYPQTRVGGELWYVELYCFLFLAMMIVFRAFGHCGQGQSVSGLNYHDL